MNISEFSTSPGASLSITDLTRLASFGFEVNSLTIYAGLLVDRILLRLAEIYPNNPKHWSRAEILDWINDGITELNLIAGYYNDTISLSWSQTENVLDLPNGVIAPMEVYYNNEVIRKYSVEGLDSKLVWDDGSVGLKPKAWCPVGTQKILVYPLSQKSTQNISVVVLAQPDPITSEVGQELEVPPQYIDAIEHYSFARARFKEAGAEFVQADTDYARFFQMANELKLRAARQRRVTWEDRIQNKGSYVRLKDEGAR